MKLSMSKNVQNFLSEIKQNYPHIQSVYATQNDRLLLEYYRVDIDPRSLLRIASATKSFSSALIGVALQQGFIMSLEQMIEDLFPAEHLENIAFLLRDVTLHQLLTMSSAIQWPPPQSDFVPQHEDIRILEGLSLQDNPGERFQYKPDVHIVDLALEATSGMNFNDFVEQYLFGPLNITRYAWHLCFRDYQGLYLSIRDFWKLGALYLRRGRWEGKMLIPESYIQASTQAIVSGGFPEHEQYGYYWWVSEVDGHEVYYASGFGGQYLFVIPEKQMILAILSEMDKPHLENKVLLSACFDGLL